MYFKNYTDDKLNDFITMWEELEATRIINPLPLYIEARKEHYRRFKTKKDIYYIRFFSNKPHAKMNDFEGWWDTYGSEKDC